MGKIEKDACWGWSLQHTNFRETNIESVIIFTQSFVFGGYTTAIGAKPRKCSVLGSLPFRKTFLWPPMALWINPQIFTVIYKSQCFEKSCEELQEVLLTCIKMDLNNFVMPTDCFHWSGGIWRQIGVDGEVQWRKLVETMLKVWLSTAREKHE